MPTNAAAVTKLALLIDGDNVSASYMPLIMREAEAIGVVAIRRIYGLFKGGRLKAWEKIAEQYGLTKINVAPLTHGKNATDMKLVIEAMDTLNGRGFDAFCIASSDGDFTPLVARIRASAVACYGFGMKKAPKGYKDEFDRFYECDTLLAAEKKTAPRRSATPAAPALKPAAIPPANRAAPRQAVAKPAPAPRAQPRLAPTTAAKLPIPTAEILAAIEAVRESDGWSLLASVSNQARKFVRDFSPKKYGFSTLKRLIASMPEVEPHTTPNGTDFVRRRLR